MAVDSTQREGRQAFGQLYFSDVALTLVHPDGVIPIHWEWRSRTCGPKESLSMYLDP